MSQSDFPVKSRTAILSEAEVKVVVHEYSNRLFVILSEGSVGGAGTLVEFKSEELSPELRFDSTEDSAAVYDIRVLFGAETPEVLLTARVLGSTLTTKGGVDKPILFAVGLKKFDKPLLELLSSTLIKLLSEL